MRAIPFSLPSAFSIKPTKSRSFLLGYATDLKRRLIEQNSGKSIPTKNFFLGKIKNYIAFEDKFKGANFKYINPNNFRHTRARFAVKQSPEYLNAARRALEHKTINTTLSSYGELSFEEQKVIIGSIKIS